MDACRDLIYRKQWRRALRAAQGFVETLYVIEHLLEAEPWLFKDGNGNGYGWTNGDGSGNSLGGADGNAFGSGKINPSGDGKGDGYDENEFMPGRLVSQAVE